MGRFFVISFAVFAVLFAFACAVAPTKVDSWFMFDHGLAWPLAFMMLATLGVALEAVMDSRTHYTPVVVFLGSLWAVITLLFAGMLFFTPGAFPHVDYSLTFWSAFVIIGVNAGSGVLFRDRAAVTA